MTELRATYRLQLGGGFGFAAGARARALPARPRDLAPLPAAVLPGARGLHARLRRRRPGLDLERARRRGGVLRARRAPRARPGWGSCSTSSRTTWRPTTRTASGRDPELREQFFDIDAETGRHRRFFDIDHLAARAPGGPGGVRGDARAGAAARARGRRRRAADRPSGRARRPRRLPRSACATAASSTSGWRRSSTPASTLRDWPVDGHRRLRVPQRRLRAVRRPRRRGAADRPVGRGLRRRPALRRATRSRPSSSRRGRRSRPRSSGCCARRRRAWPGWSARWPRFPVYRTYVEPWSGRVEDADRDAVAEAGLPASLARVLLLETPGWDAFVTRFQQTTPPVMAKGVEDTAFYRYARLLALNDVGGDPGRVLAARRATSTRPTRERAARFPRNLLVTQTHDTKRSGDVRARIGALAGMADEFAAHVRRWLTVCRSLTRGGAPDAGRAAIHLPDAARRVADLRGAARGLPREGDARGQAAHELDRARRARTRRRSSVRAGAAHAPRLPARLRAVPAQVAEAGDRAALGQLLLKLTVPGVPDIYQGDELLCLSLVDPDNRRPVDWEARRARARRPAAEAAT